VIQETREMLTDCRGHYRQIADGAGVGLHWLYKFGQGHIESPSAKKLLALHAYLKKNHRYYSKRAA
jgi:hypothetical protein